MSRIERALARLETQVALVGTARPGNPRLADEHEALRDTVSASLAQLDQLIAELEG